MSVTVICFSGSALGGCSADGCGVGVEAFGELGMVADPHEVEACIVGEVGVPEHLAHLVDAGLQPETEEDFIDGGHGRNSVGEAALTDLLKGGGGKRSGRLLGAVNGVVDAQAAEIGKGEQRFGADDQGEIEPQLIHQAGTGRFEDVNKGGQGVFDQAEADPWPRPAEVWMRDGR
jgi:hypothetical protein